ncbi:MAG: hypothetical protein MZV64_32670 [Ignavibacteriales bacterium]|nr:hypothetical protein [Ignavibacteriales bacterium]
MWATSRAVAPPNRRFGFQSKFDQPVIQQFVGHTGLGKQTNAIAFDENLNLFGVIGSSAELNDFIGINTSTGAGTIIGSIGYQHILGLVYLDEILTSIEDDNNSDIPSAYTL